MDKKLSARMEDSIRKVIASHCLSKHSAYTFEKLFARVDDDCDILQATRNLIEYIDGLYDSMLDSDDDTDYSDYYMYDGYIVAQLRNAVDARMYRD